VNKRLGIAVGTLAGALALVAPSMAASGASSPSCSGASSSTGSDTIAGPVYGSQGGGYLGVQGSQGYLQVSKSGSAPVVQGQTADGTSSVRVAGDTTMPCAVVNGTPVGGQVTPPAPPAAPAAS
jgi:hypothetical protein